MEIFGLITFGIYQVIMYGLLSLTALLAAALLIHALIGWARDMWIDVSYYWMVRQERRAARH